jgi:4-hydroxy-tetrahydrodipicolinate synthase
VCRVDGRVADPDAPGEARSVRAVIDVAKGRQVLCGTGTYNTAETLELSREAEELGAEGLLLVTPYYNKPPQAGLLEHFTLVANAVSIPVIAYNIPGRTGIRIEHDTLLRMAEVPNIVAV